MGKPLLGLIHLPAQAKPQTDLVASRASRDVGVRVGGTSHHPVLPTRAASSRPRFQVAGGTQLTGNDKRHVAARKWR